MADQEVLIVGKGKDGGGSVQVLGPKQPPPSSNVAIPRGGDRTIIAGNRIVLEDIDFQQAVFPGTNPVVENKIELDGETGSLTFTRSGKPRITLSGANASLTLGGTKDGAISVQAQNSAEMIRLDANLNYLVLRNKANKDTVWIHADPSNGGSGIHLRNKDGEDTIHLDGELGDIILANADCAEEFDVSEAFQEIEPGTVMVLDENGYLCPSATPFDKRVAGVVSGAGDYKPGIVLDRQKSDKLRLPLALVGKVFCKVDASQGAIQVGDLLTTSLTPGYAMRADDPIRAFGAVLGKALRPLASGQGLIPILVALQ